MDTCNKRDGHHMQEALIPEPHLESGLVGQVTYGIHLCAHHVAQVAHILLDQAVCGVPNEQDWHPQAGAVVS